MGILLTILTGLFFLIGIVTLNNNKNKTKMGNFTIALASVVLLGLLLFDLLPELIATKSFLLFIPIVSGFFLLIVLDLFIPHHHHEHVDGDEDKHDHRDHLNHIGIVTIVALAIHNMIEGLTLYSITLNSVKSGVLMMLGISLHNIPLGFQIGNSLNNRNNSSLLVFLLCISSFLGALIFIIFGSLDEIIINVFLALTFGMLLYILVFELLDEVRRTLKKRETIYGLIIGSIILVIAFLL